MAPKSKVTKEEIIQAAVAIVRREGAQNLNARLLAKELGCSTQPIFSNFTSMEELRAAVIAQAALLSDQYRQQETARGEFPAYKAGGMAYIRFAREERELFKLLYMRDRASEAIPEETAEGAQMEALVRQNTGLSGEAMKLFHLEMWAFVHGIASMTATGFLELDGALISKMLTDCYQGLRKQYGME